MMGSPSEFNLYGRGIFTTVRILDGKPLLWEKHWNRIASHAAIVRIDLSDVRESVLLEEIEKLTSGQARHLGRLRVTVVDDSPSPIWSNLKETSTRFSVILADCRPVPPRLIISVSPHRVNTSSPLAGVKSCNYLEQILSLDEAKNRGFHEAVRVNEKGFITSACMANVFWLKDGKLFTPSLETGCLAGTTREFILENLGCSEVEAEIGELDGAEAIFLTSAGIGIVRVAEFDGRAMADVRHPILDLWPG